MQKVWCDKTKIIIEGTGVSSEFNDNIRENLHPAVIAKADWENDNQRFEKINFLLGYSTITLPQDKDARDRVLAYLAGLSHLPTVATKPGANFQTAQ